ncbi:LEA type 2 family protein [Zestomonas thermotolerans]|uniref:LEA type 2 family protein n=1 Tax=Zestomonas thermotolerans TaxID=157784 RepID=UPI0023F4921E|nr:LEA type 2 family protein [Pseudomonas thermotolerans]
MPRLLVTLLSILVLAGCASLGQQEPLRVDLAGLDPMPSEGMEMRFAVKLRVLNPNDRAVSYDGVALNLEVNGQPLAYGVSDERGEVPRFGETVISVPVTISAFSMFRQAWGLSSKAPRQSLPYRLSGKLGGGPFGVERFNAEGELSLPPLVR